MNETTMKTKASNSDLNSTSVSARSISERSAMCEIPEVVVVCPLLPPPNEDERTAKASAPKERPINNVWRLNQ